MYFLAINQNFINIYWQQNKDAKKRSYLYGEENELCAWHRRNSLKNPDDSTLSCG